MFLTAGSLVTQYGIDETIAKFYVDREPPKNNLYWKDKQLYLRPQPGYIFLPLITDLYYRSGIEKEVLLSEEFVQVLEQIGHYSAQEEFRMINKNEALHKCMQLVSTPNCDDNFVNDLKEYFKGKNNSIAKLATPFSALHRGDFFLFAICFLEINEEKRNELIKTWFALISTLLLMDDAEDFEKDVEKDEENAFIESGSNREGFERIKALLAANLDHLSSLNKVLANALHRKFTGIAEKSFIKEYLNN